jgi:hypothetical protein
VFGGCNQIKTRSIAAPLFSTCGLVSVLVLLLLFLVLALFLLSLL